MRGLYRYQTGADRWWACAEDDDGARVHIERSRYEAMDIKPPFDRLPVEADGNGTRSARRT